MADSKTGKRFSLKDRGQWLPAVALFLCLALFAMAAIVLIGANSEPVTGHQANVTGVSAQGDQGLKRLLLARGHTVAVNRDEDGPDPLKAGLEIITLDSDQSNFLFGRNPDRKELDSSGSASSSPDSSAASQSASADASVQAAADDTDLYGAPDPKRVQHILYHPLGRAVLVVLPKWDAGQMEKHPLWDAEPTMVSWPVMIRTTQLLAPALEAPVPSGKLAPLPAGRMRLITNDRMIVYDTPHGMFRRDTRAKTAAEIKADEARADVLKGMGALEADQDFVPLRRHWALPAQNGFPALDLGVITGLQSLTAPNLTPVLTTVDGRVILSRLMVTGGRPQPKAPVYVLSDPDLLNNLILSDPKRVVAALTLIDTLMPPDKAGDKTAGKSAERPDIVFNITFNALGFDHDLLHTLTRPPFIAAPLCLLLTGLALMWAAFSRFGPPRIEAEGPPLGRGVRVLADNAARLLALTLKEARLAPAYAQHVRDLVLKERGYMQISQGQPPDDLAERIGQAHHTQDSYLDLKSRAERAMTVHQLIDITRRLHAWKTEIERAHI